MAVVSGAVERRGVLPCYGPRRVCCCSLGSLQPALTWIWPHTPRQRRLCTGVPGFAQACPPCG